MKPKIDGDDLISAIRSHPANITLRRLEAMLLSPSIEDFQLQLLHILSITGPINCDISLLFQDLTAYRFGYRGNKEQLRKIRQIWAEKSFK